MKFLLTTAALLFSALSIYTAQAQSIKEIGHLEFADTLYNFGPVNEAQGVLSYKFPFVNLGPEYFIIEDIDPSCGCITPDYPEDTIHAGEKGEIVLYVDLVNHPGVFNQKVVVKGNASKVPFSLYIQGYVTPSPQPLPEWERTSSFKYSSIYLQKNYANFGVVTTKESYSIEIPVYNSGAQAISIAADKLKLPAYIKASLLPVKIEPKQRGMLKIMLHPKSVNVLGNFAEQIELVFTSGTTGIKIPVVVTAFIKEFFTAAEIASVVGPKIQIDKTDIDLGNIKTDDKVVTEVHIANTGQAELNIKSIRTSCSCVEAFADKTTLKPGASTTLKIVFDTNDRLGAENKIISVFSNDAVIPVVSIQLKGNVVEPVTVLPGQ